jgi:hypothetical protein
MDEDGQRIAFVAAAHRPPEQAVPALRDIFIRHASRAQQDLN